MQKMTLGGRIKSNSINKNGEHDPAALERMIFGIYKKTGSLRGAAKEIERLSGVRISYESVRLYLKKRKRIAEEKNIVWLPS